MEPEPTDDELDAGTRRAWTLQLQAEHRAIRQRYNLPMPNVFILLGDARSQWGSWHPGNRVLTISRHLIRRYPWPIVVEILKHEMAHQYVTDVMRRVERHGPAFQEACRRLRVAPWAASASGELPQTPPDGTVPAEAPDTEEYRLLRRAEKLLALAESANEHEAALAMQRVRELYARHNLEHIRRQAEREYVSCVISFKRKRAELADSLIGGILMEHFFVTAVFVRTYDAETLAEYKGLDVMGRRENVELAEYVYHFLRHRAESLWQRHRKTTGAAARARADFMRGLFQGFSEKLRAPVLSPEETALVRAKDPGLEAFKRDHYPHLRASSHGGGGHDAHAFHSGHAQGRSLTIHKGVHGNAGNRGRLLGRDGG
jgi:hypothetical protein